MKNFIDKKKLHLRIESLVGLSQQIIDKLDDDFSGRDLQEENSLGAIVAYRRLIEELHRGDFDSEENILDQMIKVSNGHEINVRGLRKAYRENETLSSQVIELEQTQRVLIRVIENLSINLREKS